MRSQAQTVGAGHTTTVGHMSDRALEVEAA
jgi:hypothetical protein